MGAGAAALGAPLAADTTAQTLPPGFQDVSVFSGLTQPTVVSFSPDGRIFVAEKSGLVKVFNSLTDPTPDIFVDLRTKVHNFWDRGLLSLALDPNFPTRPYDADAPDKYRVDPHSGTIPFDWELRDG